MAGGCIGLYGSGGTRTFWSPIPDASTVSYELQPRLWIVGPYLGRTRDSTYEFDEWPYYDSLLGSMSVWLSRNTDCGSCGRAVYIYG